MDQTAAARAVMIEVLNILGRLKGDIVLIGRWVPNLHYPDRGHIGSLDVDLAISPEAAADCAHDSILARLRDRNYQFSPGPARFYRDVPGAREPVKVDLVASEYRDGNRVDATLVNELRINGLRGVDLAFECHEEITLTGTMPDGSRNAVRARIIRPEAFILVKAFALAERVKAKDAYDIAFTLHHYQPSLDDLAARIAPLLSRGLGAEAWQILLEKFASLDAVGPRWAADVAALEGGADANRERRAAYEDARALFEAVARLRQT